MFLPYIVKAPICYQRFWSLIGSDLINLSTDVTNVVKLALKIHPGKAKVRQKQMNSLSLFHSFTGDFM